MRYYTFRDKKLAEALERVTTALQERGLTVGTPSPSQTSRWRVGF